MQLPDSLALAAADVEVHLRVGGDRRFRQGTPRVNLFGFLLGEQPGLKQVLRKGIRLPQLCGREDGNIGRRGFPVLRFSSDTEINGSLDLGRAKVALFELIALVWIGWICFTVFRANRIQQ